MSEEIVGPETIKRIQLLRVSHDLKPYDLGNVTIAVASAYIELPSDLGPVYHISMDGQNFFQTSLYVCTFRRGPRSVGWRAHTYRG